MMTNTLNNGTILCHVNHFSKIWYLFFICTFLAICIDN